MTTRKYGFTVEADIHGMTAAEAKRALEQLLNTCDDSVREVDVIHGYTGGQALLNMVRRDLKHKRILSRMLSMNNGVTTLRIQPRNPGKKGI